MLTPTRGRGTDGNHLGLHIAGTGASVSVQRAARGIVEPRSRVHLRTLSTGIQMGRNLGFTTDAIDPRIEALAHDDWKASNPRAALKMAVDMFCRRAAYEVSDVTDAVTATRPDALLVDINTWGAMSAADAGDIPWACFSPYTPPLQSHGVPPFGLGLAPLPGMLGRVRDAALRPIVMGMIERTVLPPATGFAQARGRRRSFRRMSSCGGLR
jgi:hypothetical protein